ncbi:MAG: enoyl-CoA hydratase/isomerase family protein [Myxococcota bacterium]
MSAEGQPAAKGLRVEDRDRVRLLRLDRPEALNAFNDDLYDAVRDALREAACDPQIAVALVTGAGRAFSAGQDLTEMGHPRPHDDGRPHGFGPFIESVEAFPKPLVAAVNGLGVGIGLTLLLHCDLVLIDERARLRAPFTSLGVTAEAGSTQLLPDRVGWQTAARWLYTAAWIDASEVLESGLACRVCPPGSVLDEARAVATEIAQMPIESLVATKELLLAARLDAIRAARARENAAFARLVGGPANREALAAFREHRSPDFTRLRERSG